MMNYNVLSTAMALAVLDSLAGPLHIYTEDAFAQVLEKIGPISVKQDRRVTKVPYPSDKLEGYDIEAWAKYARAKSLIASTTAHEVGRLKALLSREFAILDAGDGSYSQRLDDPLVADAGRCGQSLLLSGQS